MKTCHIIGGGDFSRLLIRKSEGDLVIAADIGYARLMRDGIVPDLTVGDFDSLGRIPEGEVVTLPAHKDDTDIGAAIREGFDRGYREFALYGALGGERFSHSVANLQLLIYINSLGAHGTIYDERCTVTLLAPGTHTFTRDRRAAKLSFFAVGGDARVTLTGFSYPLECATLTESYPLGVSNELESEVGTVEVHSGLLLAGQG